MEGRMTALAQQLVCSAHVTDGAAGAFAQLLSLKSRGLTRTLKSDTGLYSTWNIRVTRSRIVHQWNALTKANRAPEFRNWLRNTYFLKKFSQTAPRMVQGEDAKARLYEAVQRRRKQPLLVPTGGRQQKPEEGQEEQEGEEQGERSAAFVNNMIGPKIFIDWLETPALTYDSEMALAVRGKSMSVFAYREQEAQRSYSLETKVDPQQGRLKSKLGFRISSHMVCPLVLLGQEIDEMKVTGHQGRQGQGQQGGHPRLQEQVEYFRKKTDTYFFEKNADLFGRGGKDAEAGQQYSIVPRPSSVARAQQENIEKILRMLPGEGRMTRNDRNKGKNHQGDLDVVDLETGVQVQRQEVQEQTPWPSGGDCPARVPEVAQGGPEGDVGSYSRGRGKDEKRCSVSFPDGTRRCTSLARLDLAAGFALEPRGNRREAYRIVDKGTENGKREEKLRGFVKKLEECESHEDKQNALVMIWRYGKDECGGYLKLPDDVRAYLEKLPPDVYSVGSWLGQYEAAMAGARKATEKAAAEKAAEQGAEEAARHAARPRPTIAKEAAPLAKANHGAASGELPVPAKQAAPSELLSQEQQASPKVERPLKTNPRLQGLIDNYKKLRSGEGDSTWAEKYRTLAALWEERRKHEFSTILDSFEPLLGDQEWDPHSDKVYYQPGVGMLRRVSLNVTEPREEVVREEQKEPSEVAHHKSSCAGRGVLSFLGPSSPSSAHRRGESTEESFIRNWKLLLNQWERARKTTYEARYHALAAIWNYRDMQRRHHRRDLKMQMQEYEGEMLRDWSQIWFYEHQKANGLVAEDGGESSGSSLKHAAKRMVQGLQAQGSPATEISEVGEHAMLAIWFYIFSERNFYGANGRDVVLPQDVVGNLVQGQGVYWLL
ncbi:unnamed protein product [Amoebophrya sp. A25]|nr:unnamed protein product [Amoebophrya sp. A25]|eukprot:GSA25T00022758001.1